MNATYSTFCTLTIVGREQASLNFFFFPVRKLQPRRIRRLNDFFFKTQIAFGGVLNTTRTNIRRLVVVRMALQKRNRMVPYVRRFSSWTQFENQFPVERLNGIYERVVRTKKKVGEKKATFHLGIRGFDARNFRKREVEKANPWNWFCAELNRTIWLGRKRKSADEIFLNINLYLCTIKMANEPRTWTNGRFYGNMYSAGGFVRLHTRKLWNRMSNEVM